jgi:ubiquinone/menaquinone biosynthesis C-methylase UbiE
MFNMRDSKTMTMRMPMQSGKRKSPRRSGYGQKLFVPSRREIQRLVALEAMADPATISVLDHIGVPPNAQCLEVGGGAGSIARHLADRVPAGHVIATDIEPTRLERKSRRANLRVFRHDVATDFFPDASFDLIHARFVLAHLPDRQSVLARMAGWLKPGGVLIIEGFRWVDVVGLDPAYTAAMAAYNTLSSITIGTDTSWSGRVPESFADQGLERIETRTHDQTRTVCGGNTTATLWRLTLAEAHDQSVAAGLATDEQFVQALRALNDPSFVGTAPVVFSTWGFRGGLGDRAHGAHQ